MDNKKSFMKGFMTCLCIFLLLFAAKTGYSAISTFSNNKEMSFNEKSGIIKTMLEKYYVEDFDKSVLDDGMYHGLMNSLGDPYTTYMNYDEYSAIMEDTEGKFSGIGIEVNISREDQLVTVITPILNTPAEKAGILPNDKIIGVDGTETYGMTIDKVVDMIKGEIGGTVNLTIFRPSSGETLEMPVVREIINVVTAKSEMLEGNIGYIQVTQFNANTLEQFQKSLSEVAKANAQGIIIDLRNNPGGSLDAVIKMTDLLLPNANIVYTIDKAGNREDFNSDESYLDVPVCVLVNGNSASASEIFSGAIQDNDRGKLVGTQTFGKGLVQGLFPLGDGTGVKITTQKYYTPSGVCIQGTGITPDEIVELPEEYQYSLKVPFEDDTQLKKGIEVITEEINAK